jgi:hypothetical protein
MHDMVGFGSCDGEGSVTHTTAAAPAPATPNGLQHCLASQRRLTIAPADEIAIGVLPHSASRVAPAIRRFHRATYIG